MSARSVVEKSTGIAADWAAMYRSAGSTDDSFVLCRLWGMETRNATPLRFGKLEVVPANGGADTDIIGHDGVSPYVVLGTFRALKAPALSLAVSTWTCQCTACVSGMRQPRVCRSREEQLSVFTVARGGQTSAWVGFLDGTPRYGPEVAATAGGQLVDAAWGTLGVAPSTAAGPNRAQRRAKAKR